MAKGVFASKLKWFAAGRTKNEKPNGRRRRVACGVRGRRAMKSRTAVLAALILIAGLAARAKVIPPRPLFLDRDITVNGASVPQGMYTLALESRGASVRATLWRGDRFIAAAHGTWVRHGIKYTKDAVLLQVNSDGTRSLMEIRLAGSAKSIVLDSESPVLRLSPGPDSRGANTSTGTLN
jgi:hypothetical protein